MSYELHTGDAAEILATKVPEGSVDVVVTSPPYFALREYGDDDREIGQGEHGVVAYIDGLMDVFTALRPALTRRAVVWVNLGDTYNAYNRNRGDGGSLNRRRDRARQQQQVRGLTDPTLRNKSLVAAPQRLAVAMVDAGWTFRADVTWRRHGLPETVRDRPRRASERVMMFTVHDRYEAHLPDDESIRGDLWSIAPARGKHDHSARFPTELAAACLAWSPRGSAVLDPFSGSGTTGLASAAAGMSYVGIDLYEKNTRSADLKLREVTWS